MQELAPVAEPLIASVRICFILLSFDFIIAVFG